MGPEATPTGDHGRWLVCPDKFKGTFSAQEIAEAIAGALGRGEADVCPLADGGEGTARIAMAALGGRATRAAAHDPLGRALSGEICLLDGGDAIVDVAAASGLGLLAPGELDAEAASTAGTGELIAAAVAHGARTVIVAAGGSATTDGGAGAIEAIEAAGGLRGARLLVLADVVTPFESAAQVFAPQKGADPGAVARLAERLDRLAEGLPRDPRGEAMGGAAGGLAGGLWARYGARLASGAGWLADAVGLDARLAGARAAITGECRIDSQTLAGKTVSEVCARGRRAGVAVHAIAASDELTPSARERLGLASVTTACTLGEVAAAARALAERLG